MGWQDLLQVEGEKVVLPWVGGKSLVSAERRWSLERRPPEPGWHTFLISGRKARWEAAAEPQEDLLQGEDTGYLAGDRFVSDSVQANVTLEQIPLYSTPIYLFEPGLGRFTRVVAGRVTPDGPLYFKSLGMPLGPEEEVTQAFLDRAETLSRVRGVPPSLDVVFRLETWRRADMARRRAEAERLRKAEEERQQREEQRRQLVETLGDAQSRRKMALVDFGEAAKAALVVGGATYLDHRDSYHRNEVVVQFSFLNRRFECTCDRATLRIIDAGICLTDHRTGEKGDTYFTLESLPGVIREADSLRKLVVFRHVGDDRDEDYDDD